MHNQIDSSFILACAPENSAADLLAERLLAHIDKGKIFRMYAASRPWDFVPQPLKVKSESLSPGFNLVEVKRALHLVADPVLFERGGQSKEWLLLDRKTGERYRWPIFFPSRSKCYSS